MAKELVHHPRFDAARKIRSVGSTRNMGRLVPYTKFRGGQLPLRATIDFRGLLIDQDDIDFDIIKEVAEGLAFIEAA